ncbi:MAG: LamG-like jellyroll fold domain-containing protein [Acholeplasmataceae bacterium]|jgi:beta-fructofuranosidase
MSKTKGVIKKVILSFIVLPIAIMFLYSCDKQENIDKRLSLYLKFDENGVEAIDSTGKNSAQRIESFLTTTQYKEPEDPPRRKGVSGKALWFDGWSTYLMYDEYQHSQSFTISIWIAPRSWEYPDGQMTGILGKYNKAKKEGFLLGIYNYGSWRLSFGTGESWIELDDANNKLDRFKWAHIAAVCDSEKNEVSIYKNGQIVNSVYLGEGISIKQTTESLTIGKNTFGLVENNFQTGLFTGLMDEIKIYDSALTTSEINKDFLKYCDKKGNIPECIYDDIGYDASLLKDDKYLPQYHIAPAGGWMNEPIAPFYYKGVWHMFYQSTASGPYWRYTQWGHWVSDDKIYWREVKPILFPEPDGMANHHVFSGNMAFDINGLPYIFYTGVNFNIKYLNRISYAVPKNPKDPYLEEWYRSDEPLFEQPNDCSVIDFRDPYIYTEGEYAYMMIGTSTAVVDFRVGNPKTVCYRAHLSDLTKWEYLGVSYEASYSKYRYLGYDWELPVFMRLKSENGMWDKYALFVSPKPDTVVQVVANVYYWLGDFDLETGKFTPEHDEPRRLDQVHNELLVITNMVEDGKNTMYGLMAGGQTLPQIKTSGWTNYVTLGKNMSLNNETGELQIKFIDEYKKLHDKKIADFKNTTSEEINKKLKAKGSMLHIKITYDISEANSAGISFRKSLVNEFGQEEYTNLIYNATDNTIILDTINSGIGAEKGRETIFNIYSNGLKLTFDIYLDNSCVEIIINDTYCMTTSIRPTLESAELIEILGDALIESLEIYSMKGIR